jgi:pimeloyl-ACP methyl ester carboxylesterase
MREHFPALEFIVFPEAGHLVHMEEAQRFAETVTGFLEGIKSGC